jgi:MerR family transcriptional regulator, thiopeptide resistance regulator
MERRYRVGEFAALTGVSIRTLHHYDRMGLLRPAARSEAGYRLYVEQDLLRLQQILTLRYLGFPLKQIGTLLDRPDFDLLDSLRIQRGALRARMAELERIEGDLAALLDRRLSSGCWDWALAGQASAALQHTLIKKGEATMNELYSPEEMTERVKELGRDVTPEEIAEVERGWAELMPDIRRSHHLNPASPEAQSLGARWDALMEATMRPFQSDDKLMATMAEGHRQGRWAEYEGSPGPEDFAFIQKVHEARTTH